MNERKLPPQGVGVHPISEFPSGTPVREKKGFEVVPLSTCTQRNWNCAHVMLELSMKSALSPAKEVTWPARTMAFAAAVGRPTGVVKYRVPEPSLDELPNADTCHRLVPARSPPTACVLKATVKERVDILPSMISPPPMVTIVPVTSTPVVMNKVVQNFNNKAIEELWSKNIKYLKKNRSKP